MAKTRKRKELPDTVDVTPEPPKKKRWSGRMLDTSRTGNKVTDRNSKDSPLLRLPAELRNRIYKLVLCPETLHIHRHQGSKGKNGRSGQYLGVYGCLAGLGDHEVAAALRHGQLSQNFEVYGDRHSLCWPLRWPVRRDVPTHSLSFLGTCRQVHNEAALLPFQECDFSFATADVIPSFLRRLMVVQQKAVRSITLCGGHTYVEERQINKFMGLEAVRFFTMNLWRGGDTSTVPSSHDLGVLQLTLSGRLKLELYASSRLTKATCCIGWVDTWPAKGFMMNGFMMNYPEQTAVICEEVEAKLLESPDEGQVQE